MGETLPDQRGLGSPQAASFTQTPCSARIHPLSLQQPLTKRSYLFWMRTFYESCFRHSLQDSFFNSFLKKTFDTRVCLPDFLGRTEVPVAKIRTEQESKGPTTRRLLLHEVPTGEVWVRFDLQLFEQKTLL